MSDEVEYPPQSPLDPPTDGVRLRVRVAYGWHGALGPGKMRLIELIDRHGSITGACREMGMSYRRAWRLVEGLKQTFREPLLTTQQGGSGGGCCHLTPYGRKVLQNYRTLERKAEEAVRKELRAFQRDLLPDAAPNPRERSPEQLASVQIGSVPLETRATQASGGAVSTVSFAIPEPAALIRRDERGLAARRVRINGRR